MQLIFESLKHRSQRKPAGSCRQVQSLPELVHELIAPEFKAAARSIQAAYAKRNGPTLSAEAILRYVGKEMRQAA